MKLISCEFSLVHECVYVYVCVYLFVCKNICIFALQIFSTVLVSSQVCRSQILTWYCRFLGPGRFYYFVMVIFLNCQTLIFKLILDYSFALIGIFFSFFHKSKHLLGQRHSIRVKLTFSYGN